MRRPIAVFTALALAFALLGFSRSILLTAASQPIRKTALRIGDQDTPYTANADYAVAVPAITLCSHRVVRSGDCRVLSSAPAGSHAVRRADPCRRHSKRRTLR